MLTASAASATIIRYGCFALCEDCETSGDFQKTEQCGGKLKMWSNLIYEYGQGGRCGNHNYDSGDVSPTYILLQYML